MSSDASTTKRARVALTVSKDSMSATVILRAPREGDPPIEIQEVLDELDKKEITYGIDHEAIQKAVETEDFNNPIVVARGLMPEKGNNSTFVYHFNTDSDHRPKEDADGHIDYKDISFIQNTEAGTELASKIPATPGKPGMNVRGKEIKGPDGRDLPFNNGMNTEVTEDGLSLKATTSGAIQFKFGKVSVNDVLTIQGDVDHSVGNINCKGSVRVSGDVKAGFEIKVDGDLEVNGKVEDADLKADGSIYIKGGFFGKGNGVMQAGNNVTLKFAEGQNIKAGGEVVIGGEAVNCTIEAGERVVVKGHKGKIVGGHARAGTEIRAGELGSDAGTRTDLTVAFDPELMERYNDIISEMKRIKEDGERVKDALYALYRAQMDGQLPPEKEQALKKLEEFQKDLPGNIKDLLARKKQVEAELAKNEDAVIIAEEMLYPGVRASFGVVYRDILEECKRCKLSLENGKVLISEYKGA